MQSGRLAVVISAAWLVSATAIADSQAPAAPVVGSATAADPQAVTKQFCVPCHNQRLKTGGLSLDTLDFANLPAAAETWEKAIRKLRGGMMPPPGATRPDQSTIDNLIAAIAAPLDREALAHPNPGRPLVHRLNRAEYANAVRDLLSLDVDVTSLLPADDSSAGFDNVADTLGVSPVLLESYLTAAERVSALAIGDLKTPPMGEVYRVRQDESQNRHIEGLPLGTVGGTLLKPTLPLDGEYEFQVRLFRTNLGTMRGLEYPQQLEISVDGERVHLASFGGSKEVVNSSENPTTTGDDVDGRFTVRVPLKAGPHTISVAFIEKTHARNTRRLQSYTRSSADTIDFSGYPHIDQIILTGPFGQKTVGATPSRRRIFICRPAELAKDDAAGGTKSSSKPRSSPRAAESTESGCAAKILSSLARRAYRGDFHEEDLTVLMDFFDRGRRETGTFDGGIDLALRRILASPKFIFRVERDPAGVAAGTAYPLDDLAIASRLSFFLWSSIPDDELLQLASQHKLHNGAVLAEQVRRMLSDPKSDALVENFVGQWLQLRNLRTKIPNSNEFPDFDDNLRQAMLTEVELFTGSFIREDRNVLELMTARDTFVNEDLAKHYGIPGVYGTRFRRITLPHEERYGLLGKGAVLMVTSHAHRTSPVLRGKWVLENILGSPPPPPPDVVPPFNEEVEAAKPRSVRDRLEQHRKNPPCANCHRVIDPVGFALENFDAVGAWRTRDGGTLGDPIDAAGQLADGRAVNGVLELRRALLRRPETFVETFTEKLLTYAVGRSLGASDMPVVRRIVRQASGSQYRLSSIVAGIVQSPPFQMRLKAAGDGRQVGRAGEGDRSRP
jgi:hypothetical protein